MTWQADLQPLPTGLLDWSLRSIFQIICWGSHSSCTYSSCMAQLSAVSLEASLDVTLVRTGWNMFMCFSLFKTRCVPLGNVSGLITACNFRSHSTRKWRREGKMNRPLLPLTAFLTFFFPSHVNEYSKIEGNHLWVWVHPLITSTVWEKLQT